MKMHAQCDIILVYRPFTKITHLCFCLINVSIVFFGSWHSNEMVHKANVMFALCFVIIIAPTCKLNEAEEKVGWLGGKQKLVGKFN